MKQRKIAATIKKGEVTIRFDRLLAVGDNLRDVINSMLDEIEALGKVEIESIFFYTEGL